MNHLRIAQTASLLVVAVCLVSISTIAGFGVMLIAVLGVASTLIATVSTGLLMETKGGRR